MHREEPKSEMKWELFPRKTYFLGVGDFLGSQLVLRGNPNSVLLGGGVSFSSSSKTYVPAVCAISLALSENLFTAQKVSREGKNVGTKSTDSGTIHGSVCEPHSAQELHGGEVAAFLGLRPRSLVSFVIYCFDLDLAVIILFAPMSSLQGSFHAITEGIPWLRHHPNL